MNKTKATFIAGLAVLGFESKAQEVLVNDIKAQLTTLEKAQDAVDNVEEISEKYATLSANMMAQKQMMLQAITELNEDIEKLDSTAPDFVEKIMATNVEIEATEAKIKAVEKANLALGGKAKAETLDALAEGYKELRELSAELTGLIDEVAQIVNKANKAQIFTALRSVVNEVKGLGYSLRDVANSIGADRVTHNGVRFYYSDISLETAITRIERM